MYSLERICKCGQICSDASSDDAYGIARFFFLYLLLFPRKKLNRRRTKSVPITQRHKTDSVFGVCVRIENCQLNWQGKPNIDMSIEHPMPRNVQSSPKRICRTHTNIKIGISRISTQIRLIFHFFLFSPQSMAIAIGNITIRYLEMDDHLPFQSQK